MANLTDLLANEPNNFKAWRSGFLQSFMVKVNDDWQISPTFRLKRFQSQYVRQVDQFLKDFWSRASVPAKICLIATGGYGRSDLFPYSDIDVLILLPDQNQEGGVDFDLTRYIESFYQLCWDAGIHLSASTRTISQTIADVPADLSLESALLETRLICGDLLLYEGLLNQLKHSRDRNGFVRRKLVEQQQRHNGFQNTAYALEPDCKDGPGALRDIQMIRWLSLACGLGATWEDLVSHQIITPVEFRGLVRHEKRLKTIRLALHLLAGHDMNVLQFDKQIQLSTFFKIRSTRFLRSSERLMRMYYRSVKAISLLNMTIIHEIRLHITSSQATYSQRRYVDDFFYVSDGVLDIKDGQLYLRQPELILKTFVIFGQQPDVHELSNRIYRGIFNARHLTNKVWRENPENRRYFFEIISGQKVTRTLRLMNAMSILGRYLRNFGRIVGQMQHDLFHVYTVDQHILMVLRNLRRFTIPEHVHEFPMCSELMADFDRPWVLYIAALFHDIAKGRGGDHSILGKRDARQFCIQHGISTDDTKLVVWLVQMHLELSQTAQKQDISDLKVIENFAQKVGNIRYLTALYLLTVADVRGTSPKVWSDWKGNLFESLYRRTFTFLQGGLEGSLQWIPHKKSVCIRLLSQVGLEYHHYSSFWEQLDGETFFKFDSELIVWITKQLWNRFEDEVPIVCCQIQKNINGLQVMVYANNLSGLFARICWYFQKLGLSISYALIQTTNKNRVLDIFQVLDDAGLMTSDGGYRQLIHLIEYELSRELLSLSPLPNPSMGRLSRQSVIFPLTPRIRLTFDDKKRFGLLDVLVADRTGLLYAIAFVLNQFKIDIHSARINTLGDRAEDVFVLSAEPFLRYPTLSHQLNEMLLEMFQK